MAFLQIPYKIRLYAFLLQQFLSFLPETHVILVKGL